MEGESLTLNILWTWTLTIQTLESEKKDNASKQWGMHMASIKRTNHVWNIPTNRFGEKQFPGWTRETLNLTDEKNLMTKPALDLLMLDFCLVRTKYNFLSVSPFLFYHCSKATVLLLFPTQMLRLSVLNVFLT